MTEDKKKQNHSENLSVFLYIAHLLPLAYKSEKIMGYIFNMEGHNRRWHGRQNFHANFTLNGWNDRIIQPARDAVLDYYKVRTPRLTYALLVLTALNGTLFIL